jgi:hypothetical protein
MDSKPRGTRPRLVIAYKPGQLSNRLLQFATFVAFAERTGVKIVNPSLDEFAPYFETTGRDLLCRYPPQVSWLPHGPNARRAVFLVTYYAARVLARLGITKRRLPVITLDWSERRYLDDSFLADVADAWVVFIQGWRIFVPPRADADIAGPPGGIEPEADLIRRHFRPCEAYRRRAEQLVARARRDHDRLIGVHIRQGDFLTDKNRGRYHYSTLQYVEKMKEVCSIYGSERVGFLVCSNQSQPEGVLKDLPCTLGSEDPVVDQHALALCDAIMGPPSSFSLWASLYGGVPLYWMFSIHEPITATSFRPFAPIDQDEVAERSYGYVNAKIGVQGVSD